MLLSVIRQEATMWKKYNKFVNDGAGSIKPTGKVHGERRRPAEGDDEKKAVEKPRDWEVRRLQRMVNLMADDRRLYTVENDVQVRKLRSELQLLIRESQETDELLRLVKRDDVLDGDAADTEMLIDQLQKQDTIQLKCQQHTRAIENLDVEILNVQKEILVEKKFRGSDSDSLLEAMSLKRHRIVENRLQQELHRFSNQLTKNAGLRDAIDHAFKEKSMYDVMDRKLTKQVTDLREDINTLVQEATKTYADRDEAQHKMRTLQERIDRDMLGHEREMKVMRRFIRHDDAFKHFMGLKTDDRAELRAIEMSKKTTGKNCQNYIATIQNAELDKLEAAFDNIKAATGQEDIQEIVEKFAQREDTNFALYHFVNEQLNVIQQMELAVEETKEGIEKHRDERVSVKARLTGAIRDMETTMERYCNEADEAVKKNRVVCKRLAELTAGINQIFKDIGCDASGIHGMLGSEKDVNNKSVMQYLTVIEQRTLQLVQLKQFLEMKTMGTRVLEDKSARTEDKGNAHLDSPELVPTTRSVPVAVVAPTPSDDKFHDVEGDIRPLTRDEIMSLVKQTMGAGHHHTDISLPEPDTAGNQSNRTE